jgi:ketosteroid isomerase-like protein
MRFLFRPDQLGSGHPVASKAEDQMDRRFFIAAAATAAGALAMPAEAQESPARSLPERFAATLSSHDIATFGAIFADDFVNHQMSAAAPAPPPDKSPKQATVGFFAARLVGIPDLKVAVETTVASNDMVAASFVYTGTHSGTYFGVAPTGRSLRFTSCDIFRVKNGQCTEHWGMGDIAGVLAQLRGSHP